MTGLVNGGFQQTLTDVQAEFEFLETVCTDVQYRTWDTLAPTDLMGIDFSIGYSYGQADMWHILNSFDPSKMPTIQKHFIIAGVPRIFWGQLYHPFGSLWTIPRNISRARSFNLTGIWNFPEGCPISNPSDVYQNFDCSGRDLTHESIVRDSIVHDTIIADLLDLLRLGVIL